MMISAVYCTPRNPEVACYAIANQYTERCAAALPDPALVTRETKTVFHQESAFPVLTSVLAVISPKEMAA